MDKSVLKNKLKVQLKNLGWRAITTVILTLTAVVTVWAYAAFTEPLAGPADSDQDFAQNILGANDANNDFISTSVASNADGSIMERQEYIQTGIGTSTDASSMSSSLFAGQQYIVDNIGGSPRVYESDGTTLVGTFAGFYGSDDPSARDGWGYWDTSGSLHYTTGADDPDDYTHATIYYVYADCDWNGTSIVSPGTVSVKYTDGVLFGTGAGDPGGGGVYPSKRDYGQSCVNGSWSASVTGDTYVGTKHEAETCEQETCVVKP